MPNQLQKSLQEYLSKMKKPPTPQVQSPSPSRSLSSSTSWILRGCKHPKTPSFAFDSNNESETRQDTRDDAATLSDIDRFLLENFKSLYQKEEDEEDSVEIKKSHDGKNEEKPIGLVFESPRFTDPPGINHCGSPNFIVARVQSASSLTEDARTSLTTSTFEEAGSSSTTTGTTTTSANHARIVDSTIRTSDDDNDDDDGDNANKVLSPDDFITVLKYSLNPYDEFKKSMRGLMGARLHHNGKIDWEFMEELLFCYLNLNDKKSYGFILRAFVDLVVVLRENSSRVPVQVQLWLKRRN